MPSGYSARIVDAPAIPSALPFSLGEHAEHWICWWHNVKTNQIVFVLYCLFVIWLVQRLWRRRPRSWLYYDGREKEEPVASPPAEVVDHVDSDMDKRE